MNYKPTEEDLIAYLYDEILPKEKVKLKAYLEAHPEEKERLKSLQETRMVFGQYEDEEIQEPITLFTLDQTGKNGFWKRYAAIAASILFLFTTAWISDFQLQYNEKGLAIGFGELNTGITEEQVAQMIYNDQLELVDYIQKNLDANKDSLELRLQVFQAALNPIELVRNAFEREKEELLSQMIALNDDLSADYREILRQIVVNFSNNIQNQRIEDLRSIQAAFTDLEEATIGKQLQIEETLEILSERIDAVVVNSNNK